MNIEYLFRKMYLIRKFEEMCFELYKKGYIKGTVHTCIGQEAVAVGVGINVDLEKDIVFSNHRGHGHFLATYGEGKVYELFSEIMGKQGGLCSGIGGSQHLHYKNFYSNGIQGGIVPVATGMTLAEKYKNSGAVGLVFIGDGTLGEGVVYESFNIASKWLIPIIFCIENNFYAQTTPVQHTHAGQLSDRGASFRIKLFQDTTNEVMSIYDNAKEAFNFVREQKSPAILYTETYRLAPHSKGDDFRDKKELDRMKLNDPLKKIEESLDTCIVDEIKTRVNKIIEMAVKKAIKGTSSQFVQLN